MPIAFLFAAPFFSRNIPVENIVFTSFCLVLLGLYLPSAWVSMRIKDRQRSVQESFPDALDMLMVCVEAGLGLDASFSRVGEQMSMAHPVLAEQFAMVSLELRAGKSREAALRNMSERVGIPEITSFVILLIQSDELGTSVASTLRVQAEEMRIKRMLRAEEKAHMLPVKMSVVLIIFLLPAMFVAILSPAIIRLGRQVIPILTGAG
jgi:tight adherence protein C